MGMLDGVIASIVTQILNGNLGISAHYVGEPEALLHDLIWGLIRGRRWIGSANNDVEIEVREQIEVSHELLRLQPQAKIVAAGGSWSWRREQEEEEGYD